MKIKILIWVFIVILLCPAVLSFGKVLADSVEFEFDVSGQISNPRGLCVSNQAIWICSDTGTRTAYKYNMDGTYSGTSCATGTSSCTGIGCNSTHLFFSNRDGGKVVIKTWGCSAVTSFNSAGLRDVDVTADGSEIWVADENSDQIDLYENKAGYGSLGSIALTGWDNAGTMFIGDYNSTIAYMIRGDGDLRTLGYFSRKSGDYLGEDTTSIFSSTDNIYGGDTNSTSGNNEGEYIRYWFINNSETNVYSVQVNVSIPPLPAPPDEQTFTITAKDLYYDSNINNLTITISNSSNKYTYFTQNGTILVSNKTNLQISKFNVTYDIEFSSSQAGGYLNNTHNINLTDGGSFTDKLYQAILYINASEVFSGSGIDEFWALSPLQINKSNSTGWAKLLLSAGSYNISANSTGYLDNKKSIDIDALSTNYENIVLGSANLSINAISIISGNSINDFSINITEISLNKKINKSTDDGSLILSAITGVYNVTIISDNFAYDSQTINILAADTLPNITFSLYTRNSINITIYDEETQKIINDTTTTLILNNLNSIMQTLYTSNGTIYKDDLFGGLWDIAVFNDFYTQRNYFVTIVDDTHTTLDVWLLNSSNGEAKTFNIRNQEDEPLEDVFITITNKVNDTYVVVAQKYSDISGQLSIFLKSTTEYRIMLEAAGYTTKIFDLEPASSLYNIILSTDVDIPFTTIYDKVSYSLTTTEGSLNFSIITSSIGGFISFFGLNSSFDGINYLTNVTGSVGGGTASIIILNSSNSTGRTIDIDYFIKLNGEDLINLHNTYYTYNATAISNYSALSVAEKYKGDFSGVMLAVISILVVVAIVATFAELGVPAAISGFAGAIILFVFSILGWLPILMTSSILIIVIGMFLFRRGD